MKRREDSFFGLHFDYHAKPEYGVQGGALTEDSIRKICRELKPDFIQIDCKGHPGWASYPSKIGNAMPEFEKDTLALWRRVTDEEGVGLYMHYSGVYDVKYCNEHPDARILNAYGNYENGATRLDSTYVDDILIPQLCELAEVYGVDGVWVDGDCWMACADYREESIAKFECETGIDLGGKAPKSHDDPYYNEFREYFRELFRRYLRHYVDTLHQKHPKLKIASNWAFSDHMPEKVCANVDFLSGDLNPSNSFNSARYAARALAQQETCWDLMSWNFRISVGTRKGYTPKHPIQIMQEAASVISVGGAYQNYVVQNRDGSPNEKELKKLAPVSEFVRLRRDFCFRGKQIHQAALLLSTYDRNREAHNLYSRSGFERTMGATALLCDIGQSLEIICEHTLEKYINEYKMIVVPELRFGLDKKTVQMLLDYAKNGGNLVLIGKTTCALFASSGAPFSTKNLEECLKNEVKETENGHLNQYTKDYKPYLFTLDETECGALYSPCEIQAENAKIIASVFERFSNDRAPVAARMSFGKGTVSAVGFDIGEQYLSGTQYMQRTLAHVVVSELYEPIVKIESTRGRLEVSALEVGGKLTVQLVNANGTHMDSTCATDDSLPPVLDTSLSILLDEAPKKLILQPYGKELDFEYKNGRAYVKIDRIDIHDIIEVVPKKS